MILGLPIALWLFLCGQLIAIALFLVRMYSDVEKMKTKLTEIEHENKELKKQLKELSDTLLLVKHSVDLLVIGRLKTGSVKEQA